MVFSMDNLNFTNMLTQNYNVVSVMSGTSLDGIDLLHVNFTFNNSWEFDVISCETVKYTEGWKKKLLNLTHNSIDELKSIDARYSLYLANQISEFILSKNIKEIDFIASHGHTALHKPEKGYTYQIGNQQVLADFLQQKVICDYRVQDVELGGQGAPLVPIGDRLLFGNYTYCINLGGFANISFENDLDRIAYDICPVNIVLNHYVSRINLEYDDKGQLGRTGNLNNTLLNELNSLSYYTKNPPKSLGLEWVQSIILPIIDSYSLELKDILRTFVEHAAIQISKALTFNDSSVLITGGGAYNLFLIERIKQSSNSIITIPSKEIIEYKEALIFGLLGVLRNRNEVNCFSSVTGAIKDHSSGNILIPKKKT